MSYSIATVYSAPPPLYAISSMMAVIASILAIVSLHIKQKVWNGSMKKLNIKLIWNEKLCKLFPQLRFQSLSLTYVPPP